jgi:hypothetical protein
MWRGQMFLMHAYSFSFGLKMVALCLISHHSPLQKSNTLPDSTAHTPTVVPYIVAESSTVVLCINDDVQVP